jgi:Pyruvate/2-oxoacid:ferredoxin oxidoreductase gamma subunit
MDHFKSPLFANTLVLGVIARAVEILDKEILLQSMLDVIPKFHGRNRQAFDLGFDHAA